MISPKIACPYRKNTSQMTVTDEKEKIPNPAKTITAKLIIKLMHV